MEIPQTRYPHSIVLVNEDGREWVDPLGWWIPIGEETDEDYERWAENDNIVEDFTSIDYPEYDPGQDFFESEGRPMFPNEY